MQQVLVVDSDRRFAQALVALLERRGFEALATESPMEALAAAQAVPPDLLILDIDLPAVGAHDLLTQLAAGQFTRTIPVIVVSANADPTVRIAALQSGADDYVMKPPDVDDLVARIRAVLRRAAQLRDLSPLTGLPGNAAIAAELRKRIAAATPLAVAHVDITNFKTFNDAYGFLRGDRVITFCGDCMRKASSVAASSEVFLGHIGGDDFVAILDARDIDSFCAALIAEWDRAIGELYDPEDAERGWIAVDVRDGTKRRHPLATLSIGVATNLHRSFISEWEVSAIAAEMKEFSKTLPGSNYQVDQRSE